MFIGVKIIKNCTITTVRYYVYSDVVIKIIITLLTDLISE